MNNRMIIQVLLLTLAVFVGLFIFIVYQYKKYILEKNKDAVFIDNKKASANFLYSAYRFFSQWPITKHYINKIRKKYEIIQPDNYKIVAEISMKTALKVWALSVVIIVISFITDISLYMMLVTISLIYIINSYTIYKGVDIAEIKLLKQCERFMEIIRHHYYKHGMVDEAIYESLPELENPILIHAEKIYETLQAEDLDEAVSKYNDIAPNQFLKTFLALCVTILKFGDRKVEGQSLFLNNITNLKTDLQIDIRKREKINHKLSGLVFLAAMPMFFLKIIENWAVGNLIELKRFYEGAYGTIISALICLSSLFIYSMLNHMKDSSQWEVKDYAIIKRISNIKVLSSILNGVINKNYGKTLRINNMLRLTGESLTVKQFYIKRILYSILTFLLCFFITFSIHHNKKEFILHNTDNLVNLSTSATDQQIIKIRDYVEIYTMKYRYLNPSFQDIEEGLKSEGEIKNKQLIELAAKEIHSRVINYQNEYFRWYELIIIFIISYVAFFIPYALLLYKRKIMQMSMEDEVIQFQSIILMLMHIERISTLDILEWIESFAFAFKQSITECINNYTAGDIEALEELKRQEPFEPFVKLVDNLIMCDKIGIEKAFDEVIVERKNFQAKRQQENDIHIDNKSAIASFIAFLPCISVIVFYIIVPFVAESLMQLVTYFNQMSMIN